MIGYLLCTLSIALSYQYLTSEYKACLILCNLFCMIFNGKMKSLKFSGAVILQIRGGHTDLSKKILFLVANLEDS